MFSLRTTTDPEECRNLWQRVIPQENISDVWEVRECFHREFAHTLRFVIAEDRRGICGLLPAVYIEEQEGCGFFPGETWAAKTWLEQNRIIASDRDVLLGMLSSLGSSYHVRYLLPGGGVPAEFVEVDEIGYLFEPPAFDYSIDSYFRQFSHKSAKRIQRDVAAIESRGISYRYNEAGDFDLMIEMNVSRFGQDSYFFEPRFRESFRSMYRLFGEKGWLRLTTVLVDGEPAAVDLGCIYKNVYTVLAGGTSAACPGIAKLINLHHMQFACDSRFERVDFLCGDFSWKTLFHLSPRPLYVLRSDHVEAVCKELPVDVARPAQVVAVGMGRVANA